MPDDRRTDDEEQRASGGESLRKRLERLNRKPLEQSGGDGPLDSVRKALRRKPVPEEGRAERPAPIVHRREIEATRPPRRAGEEAGGRTMPLDDVVTGAEVVREDGSRFLRVSYRAVELPEGADVHKRFDRAVSSGNSGLRQRMATAGLEDVSRYDVVFLDLETTGLGSSPLFLIGVMAYSDGELHVEQLFARDYSEERAVIAQFAEEYLGKPVLLTFNGKSYDLPFLRTRAAGCGEAFDWSPYHVDLLHEARRAWKGLLPNCRLQTLESLVCGRPRVGDLPGRDIPDAYHAFVHTGDAWQIGEILRHNALDLLTLADIASRLPRPAE